MINFDSAIKSRLYVKFLSSMLCTSYLATPAFMMYDVGNFNITQDNKWS